MKAGDLVRWTHPDAPDMGIVTRIEGKWAHIRWNREPHLGGMYPAKHRYLEIIK